MSSKDENKSRDLPASRSSSTDNLTGVARLPRRITPPNEILFLDNTQDARSMKSTIQRHTAYHAAAQRREARLQSSRERTPLNLEWQRRPSLERSDTAPNPSSTVETQAPITPDIVEPARPGPTSTNVDEEGADSDRRRDSTAAHRNEFVAPVESPEPAVSSSVLQNIEGDETGRRALDAYQLAIRAQSLPQGNTQYWEARERSLEQVNLVLGVLRQRLTSDYNSYSDRTIQAVLVLFVYASSFQTPDEAASHRTALERMIGLRGGLDSFGHNPVLAQQLQRFASGDDVRQILQIPSELEQ